MSVPYSKLLANYIHGIVWSHIPDNVIETAKLFVLDYIASALAGYKVNSIFNKAITNVYFGMGGKGESSVFFYQKKLPAPHAALLNAAFGHGADLDDGHRTAQGHPGVTVIPVALSLGEAFELSGKDVLLSIVVGYEIFVRVAKTINPSHFNRGFHTTGTVGTLSAAAAAAKIFGLSTERIQHTLSLACLQSGGLLEVTNSGQMAKPFHPAKAAYNGIVAALAAREEIQGPSAIFEGDKGFLKAMCDGYNPDMLTHKLGSTFELTKCYFKLYPACRHTHAAIDAALKLRGQVSYSYSDIQKIKIYTYPAAIKLTGNIYLPRTVDEAKFSLPYAVATALYKGKFTLDELDTASSCTDSIKMLVEKIEIVSDPALENREANIRGAQVELYMDNGRVISERINLPKGDPEEPVGKEDIVIKLKYCSEGILTLSQQQRVIDFVENLEKKENINQLTGLLRKSS
jgi:2-methylcitrate dehydratase PrpD